MAEVVNESANESAVDGRALYAKISWRLIPYMFLLYIVTDLERVNVGVCAFIRSVIWTSEIPFYAGGLYLIGGLALIAAMLSLAVPETGAFERLVKMLRRENECG